MHFVVNILAAWLQNNQMPNQGKQHKKISHIPTDNNLKAERTILTQTVCPHYMNCSMDNEDENTLITMSMIMSMYCALLHVANSKRLSTSTL